MTTRELSLVSIAVLLLQGCGHVPAYDRAKLAHRTMAKDYGETAGRAHTYAVQEGAMGGVVAHGSGCGCN